MQSLCHHDVQADTLQDALDALSDEASASQETVAYARALCEQYREDRERIDQAITDASEHWDLDRLDAVDRNVIRIAQVELLAGEIPPKVVFNEAIEIGREFGSAESPAFINGLLEAAWKRIATKG